MPPSNRQSAPGIATGAVGGALGGTALGWPAGGGQSVGIGGAKPSVSPIKPSTSPKPTIPANRLPTETGIAEVNLNTKVSDLATRGLLGVVPWCGESRYMVNNKFTSSYPDVGVEANFDKSDDRLFSILISSSQYRFNNGIKVGSAKAELEKAYGSKLETINHEGHGRNSSPGFRTNEGWFVLFLMTDDNVEFIIFPRPQKDSEPYGFLGC